LIPVEQAAEDGLNVHRFTVVLLSLSFLLATGCTGLTNYAKVTEQARFSISQGRFEDALTAFPDKYARGKDEVLVRLERATLLQLMGKYDESSREFQLGAAKIREYEEKAVISASRATSQLGSLLLNEQVRPYEGEDFEKILIHAFGAVNYLMTGDLEGARVEIRNAYQRQNELKERHEKALEKAEKESRGTNWQDSFQKADSDRYRELKSKAGDINSIYQNAFAYYISSLVYELGGEEDEAYIDLKKGIEAAPWSKSIRKDLIRLSRRLGRGEDTEQWQEAFGKLEDECGKGLDIFVIFQHGVAPVKEELSFPVPLSRGGLSFASLPVYRFVPSSVRAAELVYEDRVTETSLVSDTDAIASRNLLDQFPVLFAKQVARSYFKARMTSKLSKEYGAIGAITGTIAAAITERADLRAWASLPKEIQVVREFVPESTKKIVVRGTPSTHAKVIDIPEGTRHLIVFCRDTEAGLSIQTKAY